MPVVNNIDVLTFPLSGTRLIEASAGTGKTYTIAALYVRLVLGHGLHGAELLPPDILVVTFTDAATKELRERIRSRLTQAASYFREKSGSDDDFLVKLRAAYPAEQWAKCAYRLELAANWMDEAAVYTIHAWCNRMLQQHAFDSGNLFRQEVDTDDQELLNQVVRDYWRQFFYPLSVTACQAVYQLASSPEQLTSLLKPLLFETEALGLECTVDDISKAFNEWESWENQRIALEAEARELWLDQQQTLEKLLKEASEKGILSGSLYRKASFADKLSQLAAWAANSDKLDIDALAKFGQQKLQAGLTKAHQDKTALFEHPAFQAIDRLAEHCQQEIDIADLITRHALHWLRARYDCEKQRIARMTFDDMLTRLDRALQGPNGDQLSSVIVKQHPIALIDEFQDTDPVQYRIFARLYPSDATQDVGCFMIGDPKQAIYSFRGGDIFTYLKAHQATLGRHYTLGTNYRSTKDLIDAVNQIFSYADDRQTEGAFCFKRDQYNPLPFLPVSAHGREDELIIEHQPAPAMTLWQISSDEAVGMPDYRWQMAAATASEIVRLLYSGNQGETGFKSQSGDIRPLQPADIAILVRSGNEATMMRKALSERHLRSVYLSERESIYTCAEAGDVLIWLKALAEPRDERKVRAALSTATLGWSNQSLQQLTLDELAWEQQLERFIAYQQRWQQDGILPTLRQLMTDYAIPARLKKAADGERRLTNLLHLAELLQQASARLEGEQALIRHLAETISADQTAEENVIRLESDANLIKIVTIHKSKGLEYPLVFLPFICSFREVGGANTRYYRFHDNDYRLSIDLYKDENNKALSDKERLQEDLRLLYVAVTRARYACWLGIAPIKSGNSKLSHLQKSAIGYLLCWQAGTPSNELNGYLQKLKGDCDGIVIAECPEPSERIYQASEQKIAVDEVCLSTAKINDNWWIASYSALQTEAIIDKSVYSMAEAENFRDDKQTDEAEPIVTPPSPISDIHGLPRGADPGVCVHELLEQCAQQGFDQVQSAPEQTEALIANIFQHRSWENKHGILAQALQQWLHLPLLENSDLTLAKLESSQYQAEMEFLLGASSADVQYLDALVTQYTFNGRARPRLLPKHINGLLKGFIDLVFEDQGRYYVLDYKFNSLGDSTAAYTLDALEDAMLSKRYDLQSALYLLALHRLLKVRLGDAYDYDRHIGGSIYLFLRGVESPTSGRMMSKPPKELLSKLDLMFSGQPLAGTLA